MLQSHGADHSSINIDPSFSVLTWDCRCKAEVRWQVERSFFPPLDFPWHEKEFRPSRSGIH